MFQCRNYLSNTNCATCFAAAVTKIHNCSPSFSPFSKGVEVQRGRVGVAGREKREMEFQREIESDEEEKKENGSRFQP